MLVVLVLLSRTHYAFSSSLSLGCDSQAPKMSGWIERNKSMLQIDEVKGFSELIVVMHFSLFVTIVHDHIRIVMD